MLTIDDTEILPFVHVAIDCDVRVAIDDAGHHELAGGIDNLRVFRNFFTEAPTSAIFHP